jgi:signal transduction histidine kinase
VALVNLLRPVFAARTWKETAYLLLDLPVAIVGFTTMVTLFATGLGLLVTLIGIPILAGALVLARLGGRGERARARLLLDLDLPEPPPRAAGATFLRQLFAPFRDLSAWRAAAYFGFVTLPLGIFTFVTTTVIWSVSLGLLTLPIWAWSLPGNGPQLGDHYYWNQSWQLILAVLIGATLTVLAPWLIRGLAWLARLAVRAFLGTSRHALERRVVELRDTRARSVDAAVEERRRIERDLHDGAQQRLVAVGMDLGLALEKFEDDPESARKLVDDAHREAQRAIGELRSLVRGMHPAILEDRGLDAALSALAARTPFPVRLHVDVPTRPPASIEANAYFIVAESLVNATRHSHASFAEVDVTMRDGAVRIEIVDDGVGGADLDRGTGLQGLADRAAAVDGTFDVVSPPGGGTRIVAELPCAS